jgi:protein-tyrosine phosphatase
VKPTIYEIERIGSGCLAVMGRPRAGDWAADEFAGLAELGITDVVSLLERSEAYDIGLAEEAQFCEAAGICFHSYPITDRGLPPSVDALSKLACQLYHLCAGGAGVAIHCRAGIGRSGLLGAAVLLHCGFSAKDAFAKISAARGVPVPDTAEQAQWLIDNQAALRKCHVD